MDRACDMESGNNGPSAKSSGNLAGQPGRAVLLSLAGVLLFAAIVRPQLAITEMMSKSANTFGQTTVTNDTDFWELTNFGANTVNLAGYKFADNKDSKRLLVPNGA